MEQTRKPPHDATTQADTSQADTTQTGATQTSATQTSATQAGTTQVDAADGDAFERDGSGSVATYTVGLLFALLLTGGSFLVSQTNLLWAPGVSAGLAVLAIAQMGVHLVFFLHISTGRDNANNVLALAFGVMIVTLVVGGSLWIMANLNANMLSPAAIMQMQR